jgi:ATP-binding cassette subfamily B protein
MNSNNDHLPRRGFSRLLEIAGERQTLLAVSGFFSILSTFLMFFPYLSTFMILRELFRHSADPATADMAMIRNYAGYTLAAMVVSYIFFYISTMASHISAFRILYNLRIKLASHLASLPMGFHNRQSTGAIKKAIEISVEKIEGFIAHQLPDLVSAIFFPVVLVSSMFLLEWRLALFCALPVIGAFVLQIVVFSGKQGKNAMRHYHDALENMNAAGVEYVRGMPAVKVFGLTVKTFLSFHDSIEKYRNWAVKHTGFCQKPYIVFTTVLASILAFVLPAGIFLLSQNPANQAFALTLLLFLVLSPGLSTPVFKLMFLGGNMRMISEGVDRIDQYFAQQPIPEPCTSQTPSEFDVEFAGVSFSYASKSEATREKALANVSFLAGAGQTTAIVGPSGSGKSTIACLLSRFWDVDSGSIRIGGIDIREMGTAELMNNVSFVFQDVYLFYDTIEENIRMGNQAASHADVVAASRAACCHDFIEQLPDGYQTRIGEGGTSLSGGEAQRVAIARAILKNTAILILDEATAFADPANEARIQTGLNNLSRGRTVIIIAHRLSTIRHAHQIIVLDAGSILESGTHDELITAGGLYYRMWNAHISAESWTIKADNMPKQGEKQ